MHRNWLFIYFIDSNKYQKVVWHLWWLYQFLCITLAKLQYWVDNLMKILAKIALVRNKQVVSGDWQTVWTEQCSKSSSACHVSWFPQRVTGEAEGCRLSNNSPPGVETCDCGRKCTFISPYFVRVYSDIRLPFTTLS